MFPSTAQPSGLNKNLHLPLVIPNTSRTIAWRVFMVSCGEVQWKCVSPNFSLCSHNTALNGWTCLDNSDLQVYSFPKTCGHMAGNSHNLKNPLRYLTSGSAGVKGSRPSWKDSGFSFAWGQGCNNGLMKNIYIYSIINTICLYSFTPVHADLSGKKVHLWVWFLSRCSSSPLILQSGNLIYSINNSNKYSV